MLYLPRILSIYLFARCCCLIIESNSLQPLDCNHQVPLWDLPGRNTVVDCHFLLQNQLCPNIKQKLNKKYHRLGQLNRNVFSCSSGVGKSVIKILLWAGSVEGRPSSWLVDSSLLCASCGLSTVCTCGERSFPSLPIILLCHHEAPV